MLDQHKDDIDKKDIDCIARDIEFQKMFINVQRDEDNEIDFNIVGEMVEAYEAWIKILNDKIQRLTKSAGK